MILWQKHWFPRYICLQVVWFFCLYPDSANLGVGRKPRVESGYFSLEKNKPEEEEEQHQRQQELSSSPSSRFRYLSFYPQVFSSPDSSSQDTHTSHETHTPLQHASRDTHALCDDACVPRNANKHNMQRANRSDKHHDTHTSVDGPSLDFQHCSSRPDTNTHTCHTNILPSSLSSSQSSLDSEQSTQHRGPAGALGRAGRGGQGYAALADVPRAKRLNHREAFRSSQRRQEVRARTRSPGREEVERLFGLERRWPARAVTYTHRFCSKPSEDASDRKQSSRMH